jgi:endogenous inhibitor of DNA gyrase (YacG/DUF329 family)
MFESMRFECPYCETVVKAWYQSSVTGLTCPKCRNTITREQLGIRPPIRVRPANQLNRFSRSKLAIG